MNTISPAILNCILYALGSQQVDNRTMLAVAEKFSTDPDHVAYCQNQIAVNQEAYAQVLALFAQLPVVV